MKNPRQAFYIILAAVLITGLIFSLFAFSKIRAIRGLRTAIEKTAAERERLGKKDADGSTQAQKSIPRKMWTTEFIETVYSTSQKYGIRDLTFEQKSVESSRRQAQGIGRITLQSYPLRMTFHAGYREMAEFIQKLQGLEKLVTIDSLKIKREQGFLAIEMTASTYAMEEK